jgi:tungstate transport system substrate-binding protein
MDPERLSQCGHLLPVLRGDSRRPAVLITLLALALASCHGSESSAEIRAIVLATTTSVEDSGLLEAIAPQFHSAHTAYRLRVVAVGSGEALALGRRGDADVLLTHSPAAEAQFVAEGHGTENATVMHNHFVIVGPDSDPAGVRRAATLRDALRNIANAAAMFLTRGDSSGTHLKELELWRLSVPTPPRAGRETWYIESGLGMGDLLRVASERGAYTLTDRATFMTNATGSGLEIVYDDRSEPLYNPYTITVVTKGTNPDGARAFRSWLLGPAGQAAIAEFGATASGRPPFVPAVPR